MIKLVTFLKRSERLTRPAFEERWATVHAPIAAGFPGLRGYMLSFSIEPGEPAADGVAQLWFDSREAAQESYASDMAGTARPTPMPGCRAAITCWRARPGSATPSRSRSAGSS